MADNLVETIQKNLGFPQLQKIDPNTQEVKKPEEMSAQDYLPQAAIPVVLLGLYKFSRTEEGNIELLKGELQNKLLKTIFGKSTEKIINKVASNTGNTTEFAASKMEVIAWEALSIIRKDLSVQPTDANIKTYLADQRHNLLVHLPASLQIGETLHDDTIDDRTHKMEGPISNHMHWLEKFFPSADRKKEENF
ncbi:MAG: hypothetical protein WKF59_24650 [Chitinophagaceae bacterium]